jgi:NAD(P)H-hydrate repair Nnr-like enzyme with NAD(P)H-hydrate dehydratase domain
MSSSSSSVVRPNFVNMIHGLLPALQVHANKGQAGRVGVIGGSKAFAGAPYFAAMTAMRMVRQMIRMRETGQHFSKAVSFS